MSDAEGHLKRRGIVLLKDAPEPPSGLRLDGSMERTIREGLRAMGRRDLYDFLGRDRASEGGELRRAAGKKSNEYLHSRSAHRDLGKELAGKCLLVFKNREMRRKYEHSEIHERLGVPLEVAGHDGELERHEVEGLLDTAEGLRRDLVIRYIWSWARMEGVKVAWPFLTAAPDRSRARRATSGPAAPASTPRGTVPGGGSPRGSGTSPHPVGSSSRTSPPARPVPGSGAATGPAGPGPSRPSRTSTPARSAAGGGPATRASATRTRALPSRPAGTSAGHAGGAAKGSGTSPRRVKSAGSGGTSRSVSADRDALMALYRSASGSGWSRSDNWGTNAPLSAWWGVTVDDGGRVVRLDLSNNDLTGSIPPELGGLANLRWLALHENKLKGAIPRELYRLGNLEVLMLGSNKLTGTIPPELGGLANLRWLNLDKNKLKGAIPRELYRLANLEVLDLGRNKLTGTIY